MRKEAADEIPDWIDLGSLARSCQDRGRVAGAGLARPSGVAPGAGIGRGVHTLGFDKNALAANLRAMRARLDKTQGDIAREVGVNVGTLVKYESGDMVPGAENLFALAGALGCTPNDLMGWPGERKAG